MLSPLTDSFDLLRSYLGLLSPEDLQPPKSPYAARGGAPWSAPWPAPPPRGAAPLEPASRFARLASTMAASGDVIVANTKEKVKSAIRPPLLAPQDELARRATMQDSAWADGLRGIASLYVVASHIVMCVARRLVLPCCVNDQIDSPLLFQRPIFRLISQGHSWVALFFILLGFVNSLKPIKLARAGQYETALTNLAVSSFRRAFRLVLPATAATVISWLVCQLGLYETARNGDAFWLYTYTPMESGSWGQAIGDLVMAIKNTWAFNTDNAYDQPQWALIHLLQGSVMVFTGLLMTVKLTPMWRSVWMLFLMAWSFNLSSALMDPMVGFTVFGGIYLAELSLSDLPFKLSRISTVITPPLVLVALVMMSFPSIYADKAPWSNWMLNFGNRHLPDALRGDLSRAYGSMGGLLLVLAIIISPHARRLLSRKPLLWLGKVSFPIYLLHGTFLRTVFAWIVFTDEIKEMDADGPGGAKIKVQRYAQGGEARIVLGLVVSMGLLLVACHFWAKKVEPLFGNFTKFAEDWMTGQSGSKSSSVAAILPSSSPRQGATASSGLSLDLGPGRPVLPTHHAAVHSE